MSTPGLENRGLSVGMTATALWMCHKGVSWGAQSRGVYERGERAGRNEFQQHDSSYFTLKPQAWISWLLCTHPLCTPHPDWMCSGNGKIHSVFLISHDCIIGLSSHCFSSGFIYQEEIKVSLFLQSVTFRFIWRLVLCSVLSPFGFFSMFCFRLDELRHRLIPLYSYDPAEQQEEWGDTDREENDEELAVRKPLY